MAATCGEIFKGTASNCASQSHGAGGEPRRERLCCAGARLTARVEQTGLVRPTLVASFETSLGVLSIGSTRKLGAFHLSAGPLLRLPMHRETVRMDRFLKEGSALAGFLLTERVKAGTRVGVLNGSCGTSAPPSTNRPGRGGGKRGSGTPLSDANRSFSFCHFV